MKPNKPSEIELPSWIFQCNPDQYDIDGLLASEAREVLFAARQNSSRMLQGDTVFIWRAKGKRNASSGIVARGHLLDTPRERIDDSPGSTFWTNPSDANTRQMRVRLHVSQVANKKEIIQRDWLLVDPVLKDLSILKMANKTNFPVEGDQLKRIEELWENTGNPWSRAQSVAALYVYHQTYGGSLSLRPDAPIAKTATLTGRAVKGFYNKVLNFRHIDPRDKRAGFSGAGETDREVWREFYDPTTEEIKAEELELEFRRLWYGAEIGNTSSGTRPTSQQPEPSSKELLRKYRPGPTPQPGEYSVTNTEHDNWFVYVLKLGNREVAKVGFSHDPKKRLKQYNLAIMPEITGLKWSLAFTHRVEDAEKAKNVEQTVLSAFSGNRLPSNGEILRDVDTLEVQLAIIQAAKEVL
ncbi:EVE domain-containing protein [Ruegeria arenilitoris]|uniref:EVE domain-containing protein n=1 Tax=Ruegeria arenilitoris TaxID=1173585 RepID=UPI00147A6079|nr:EVE domain-containing protein [Ruegeria arenilitoris]